MTQEQRERLARLVLGAAWSPDRIARWEGRDGVEEVAFVSAGERILVAIWRWLRTGRPAFNVLVSDLAKLDERCRQRVVFALRLMFAGGASDWVEGRLAAKERQDAELWREVAA